MPSPKGDLKGEDRIFFVFSQKEYNRKEGKHINIYTRKRIDEHDEHISRSGKRLPTSVHQFQQNIKEAEKRIPWTDSMNPWSASRKQGDPMMNLHNQIRCRLLDTEKMANQDKVDLSLLRAQFEVFRPFARSSSPSTSTR